ncbi:MAG: dethiobiotin synthase [Bacteroidetes bacterium]|nr:dethiobiotin synthase [Bacteroidota bacterium]
MNKYFITGIGTGIGKTVVSAILAEALNADYWKPVQCGTGNGTDKEVVTNLLSNQTSKIHLEDRCYREAVSPHMAAALNGEKIIMEAMELPMTDNDLIIEGAGGLLVPLNETSFVIDMATFFEAEVVLVIRNYLGCINHSLLSIDYLTKNGFEIKGLVLIGTFDNAVRASIINYAELPIIAEIPEVTEISKETILHLSQKVDLKLFEN